jgi:hypothetical protein
MKCTAINLIYEIIGRYDQRLCLVKVTKWILPKHVRLCRKKKMQMQTWPTHTQCKWVLEFGLERNESLFCCSCWTTADPINGRVTVLSKAFVTLWSPPNKKISCSRITRSESNAAFEKKGEPTGTSRVHNSALLFAISVTYHPHSFINETILTLKEQNPKVHYR